VGDDGLAKNANPGHWPGLLGTAPVPPLQLRPNEIPRRQFEKHGAHHWARGALLVLAIFFFLAGGVLLFGAFASGNLATGALSAVPLSAGVLWLFLRARIPRSRTHVLVTSDRVLLVGPVNEILGSIEISDDLQATVPHERTITTKTGRGGKDSESVQVGEVLLMGPRETKRIENVESPRSVVELIEKVQKAPRLRGVAPNIPPAAALVRCPQCAHNYDSHLVRCPSCGRTR
jgi:hypothetical protein